jgi:hypothetical protein
LKSNSTGVTAFSVFTAAPCAHSAAGLAFNAASQPFSPSLRRNSTAEINPPPEIVEFCENCVDSETLQKIHPLADFGR